MEIVLAIIKLLAGLGAFLIAFKLLSENIEKVASRGLRHLFSKTSNRFVGVGVGLLITALLQSSSITTVMVVGFVNSGIMNLFQATAIIMGANIGSTITAQIVALQSFNISSYAILLTAIGMIINVAFKKERYKSLGLAIAGFGLIFLSLDIMQGSMDVFKNSATFTNLLKSIENPLLLLLIGIIITAIVQSSAVVTTIVISMAAAGISIGNGGNSVLFVVIGSNIGTCVTALLSSFGASQNAKRASLIHLLFNVFAAIIFVIFLLIYKGFVDEFLASLFKSKTTQIAMFHTFFNVVSVILFLPFINVFVKIANTLIKDKNIDPDAISNLDERLLSNSTIAISQAIKETSKLGDIAINLLSTSVDAFINLDLDFEGVLKEKIQVIDKKQENLLNYLIKISSTSISQEEEKEVSALHNIINDFYREVEIADNMRKYIKSYLTNDLDFSKEVFDGLRKMKDLVISQYQNVKKVLENSDFSLMETINSKEEEIDNQRAILMADHMARLEKGQCKIQNSGVFINLVSNLERAGDHLNYIAQSIYNNH